MQRIARANENVDLIEDGFLTKSGSQTNIG